MADVDCGISKLAPRAGRIVNGLDVTEGEFPWYILLINAINSVVFNMKFIQDGFTETERRTFLWYAQNIIQLIRN